jgi:hypothetical protein
MSKDGIKIRPPKTVQGIRQTSLKQKGKAPIELRIGHDNIDVSNQEDSSMIIPGIHLP